MRTWSVHDEAVTADEVTTKPFVKYDKDKPELNYLIDTPLILEEIVRVRKFGGDKYGRLNWHQCPNPERYIAAALRHIIANGDNGLTPDDESGYSHISHAICSLMFYAELQKRKLNNKKEG